MALSENFPKSPHEISSACATQFNQPIRPSITPVAYQGNTVLVLKVSELISSEKPLFFKSQNLPRGAWRRVGSTDQRCTEDDLTLFYTNRDHEPLDRRIVASTTMDDLDSEAVEKYRKLRAKVNPAAEELRYDDHELLQALGAIRRDDQGNWCATLTGLLLFGTRIALRRELPGMRVDYIRVSGKDWVPDPEKRYESTVDMRGPLLSLVDRAQAAVLDDLPRGFELPDGNIQAVTPSLPARVLREAIVNAVMHRTYRIHEPIQIIRYSNRVEIRNPGFSLKNEDQLGTPGSQLRNPYIAAIFHETNTAETKGTGIRVMREQMKAEGFSPPTFESDRDNQKFTTRLLLHHFLSEPDLIWLRGFDVELSEPQRYALIFTRENGAIDNSTLRQLTGEETLTTSQELRKLRDLGYLEKKGGGASTYYVPGPKFHTILSPDHGTLEGDHGTLGARHGTLEGDHGTLDVNSLLEVVPISLREKIAQLGSRPGDTVRDLIIALCQIRPWKAGELAAVLGKRDTRALRRDHLRPMVDQRRLELTHPEMDKHPDQAYKATDEKN